MDLEDLSAIYSDDNRVVVIENLDDIGEPYTCEQWASGAEDYQFFTDDGDDYLLFDMLSINNLFAEKAIIDQNKVFRYLGIHNEDIVSIIDSILESWVLGDTNSDQNIDILDIIIMMNNIFDSNYSYISDINEDDVINIQDIIILLGIILGENY